MRWYSAIILIILLLQLSLVGANPPACQEIDQTTKPISEFVKNGKTVDLSDAEQKDIDELQKQVKGQGKNAWHCSLPIKMTRNPEVATLSLPPRVYGLELIENPNLEHLNSPEFVDGKAVITGNNKLNQNQNLKEFEKIYCPGGSSDSLFKKCTVTHNECWFEDDFDINLATELDHCTKITSDLSLVGTEGTISTKLTDAKCVIITQTQLEDLKFLEDVGSFDCNTENGLRIDINRKLCISYGQEKKYTDKNFKVSDNYDESCSDLPCSFDQFKKAKEKFLVGACSLTIGNAVIDCQDKKTYRQGYFKTLKGALTLQNCDTHSAIEKIEYFTEIDADKEIAVTLQNPTDNLEFLKLPGKTLKGSKMLKIVRQEPFSFIEATRIRMAFVNKKEEFDKIEFSNEDAAVKGECVGMKGETIADDCEIIVGDLFLDSNSSKVSSKLKEVKGCLHMDSASHLENYDFLKNLTVNVWEQCWSTDGRTDVKDTGCIPLEIRQTMTEGLLKVVTPLEKNNIQKCDCFYNESVPEIPETCTIIDGDLILSQYTRSIPSKIEEVTGCIKIFNGFDPDLSFLKYFTNFNQNCIYGNGVSGIYVECIPFGILPTIDQQKMKIQNNPAPPRIACGECNSGNVQDIDYSCKIIIGSVMVKGVGNGDVERKMENVEVIYGALIIEQNEADKIVFPALKRIEVGGGDDRIALNITDNKNLVSIELPRLESISVNGSTTGRTLINIQKNPNWNASESFQTKIKALTGSDCSDVKGSGCFLKKEPLKPTEKEKASERELRIELAMGMGITSAVLLTIGSPILALGLYWRRARQKMGTW